MVEELWRGMFRAVDQVLEHFHYAAESYGVGSSVEPVPMAGCVSPFFFSFSPQWSVMVRKDHIGLRLVPR